MSNVLKAFGTGMFFWFIFHTMMLLVFAETITLKSIMVFCAYALAALISFVGSIVWRE